MTGSERIHPVILSGGAGTRLWPLSRELYPKQILPFASDRSLLQETVRRVGDADRFAPPLVICNDEHRFLVAEQLREIGHAPRDIVLEPQGRNTAPAVAVAAVMLLAGAESADPGQDPVLLVLPADHVIADPAAFRAAVERAAPAARGGALVTFGIRPDRPETGYGYIQGGAPLEREGRRIEGCFAVARFTEKPDLAAARGFVAAGGWFWNSGIFLLTARRYLAELARLRPDMLAACREAVARGAVDLDFFRLDAAAFARVAPESIDYAVMEHTTEAAVVPVEMGWSDVGSWAALWEVADKDAAANVVVGDVVMTDVRGSYLRSEAPLLAVIGLADIVLVATDDVVLAAPKDRAQDVKKLVEELKARGRTEYLLHSRVYRPWGYYQTIDAGDRFQVKELGINPGAKLSLQKHDRRAEHWVVVNGTAKVTRGDDTFLLKENESTYIPAGTVHRLENPEKTPLRVIEVQSGSYLGEDDIVRSDDTYGRG